MNKLKIKISERFQWPEWVTATKDCFDFVCSNDKLNQEETLGKLLNLLKTPITEEKKIVIMEQYIGVRYCANEYLKGTPNTSAEELWYYLCTTEEVYKGREDIFQVAVQFLVRSFNECIVESYFSAIVEVHGNLSRPRLSAETASMITFIQRNGPHPIKSEATVRAAVKRLGAKFISDQSKFFTSAVLERRRTNINAEWYITDMN